MLFELSVALKYLLPRRQHLSVSLISIVSILIISLVVWLVLVFLSVSRGLEQAWIEKLVSISAPVRLVPTKEYFHSFYYQIDNYSSASQYQHKTIGEKRNSPVLNPYNPSEDPELPLDLQKTASSQSAGQDIVKETFAALRSLEDEKSIYTHDYQGTVASLHLRFHSGSNIDELCSSTINQFSYFSSFDAGNPYLHKILLPMNGTDYAHFLEQIAFSCQGKELEAQLRQFFSVIDIMHLATKTPGWRMPQSLLLQIQKPVQACALFLEQQMQKIVIPEKLQDISSVMEKYRGTGYDVKQGSIVYQDQQGLCFSDASGHLILLEETPILLPENVQMVSALHFDSLRNITHLSQLQFHVQILLQGQALQGTVPYYNCTIGALQQAKNQAPLPAMPTWMCEKEQKQKYALPQSTYWGEGIVLPRSFREKGVSLFDQGHILYQTPTPSGMQEQQIAVYVAAFYDPGIMPVSVVLAPSSVLSSITGEQMQYDPAWSNGIGVWFSPIKNTSEIKRKIQQALQEKHLLPYWTIETYEEYDFAKDLVYELRSQNNLFNLLAIIIIIVACSNIVSMLILLVNDKKIEIAILQSMGASKRQIATIFGLCGICIGFVSCAIGTTAAWITMRYLPMLIHFLSQLQGHPLLNPIFYGDTLPNQLRSDVLALALIATAILSLFAGLIPAIKATLLNPAQILKQ